MSSSSATDTILTKKASTVTLRSSGEAIKKSTTCFGRKISRCDCISSKQIFVIVGIIGAVLLVFGGLALAGTFAPQTGGSVTTVLQKLKYATDLVAAKLGTSAFTLSIFTASFGAGFTFTGLVGFAIKQCRESQLEENLFS